MLQTRDQREPLVQYVYSLIRAQLDERGTSHRQLEVLVRSYPHYWSARRALVYSVTNEKSYIRGAAELKKFYTDLTKAIQSGNHSNDELEALLAEYFWVVDTAAVFEMKPKTKKLADLILNDPRSKQMIADAEERLQAVLKDQQQRAAEKAAEKAGDSILDQAGHFPLVACLTGTTGAAKKSCEFDGGKTLGGPWAYDNNSVPFPCGPENPIVTRSMPE